MNISSSPLRIFIVENHEDTLTYLKLYLEQKGHQVYAASDMQSALKSLTKHHIDVLISDIRLPDGDGWELMQRATKTKNLFGIAMSGLGRNVDESKSKSVGYRHHLTKPFLPEELDILLAEASQELA